MWTQFLLENFHFAVNLFSALVFFAVFWLYWDSRQGRVSFKEVTKLLGFLLLTFSFFIHATHIESAFLVNPLVNPTVVDVLFSTARLLGYLLIILGLFLEPLSKTPIKDKSTSLALILPSSATLLYPVLASVIGFVYLRRATLGMEKHLKTPALAFYLLTLSELLHLTNLWQKTPDIDVYTLIAPFGIIWLSSHLVLLVSVAILGRWVFGYLLKRFQSQLFMIFTLVIQVIFLLTTVSFTGLLVKNLEHETLNQIEVDAKVLTFAVDAKKDTLIADSLLLAKDQKVTAAFEASVKSDVSKLVEDFLLAKKLSTVVIVDTDGLVIARGEDRDRIGDSLSSDPLVKKALLGSTVVAIVTKEGALTPEVSIRVATPVTANDETIGVALLGSAIDNAFVDGVKDTTGLAVSIYADNKLSATSLVLPDGKTRPLGLTEENQTVKTKVLQEGEKFTGAVRLLNTDYFAAYLPLLDSDNTPVGMLFVGKPQTTVLQTAAYSVSLTFMLSALLLAFSPLPAYLVARGIAKQVR